MRQLVIEKESLRTRIICYMKKNGIPTDMIGSDLFKGVVFSRIRHPEIDLPNAIDNAVNASKLPGTTMTRNYGVWTLLKFIEVFTDINDVNWYVEKADMDYSKAMEDIKKVVDLAVKQITTEYCRNLSETIWKELASDFKINRNIANTIWTEIIQDMCFMMLCEPDTPYELAYQYASRKAESYYDEDVTKERLEYEIEPIKIATNTVDCEQLVELLLNSYIN